MVIFEREIRAYKGFYFCARNTCYIMRRLYAGVGLELTRLGRNPEERSALEHIVGSGTDQVREKS
jgi:hypothetical protein